MTKQRTNYTQEFIKTSAEYAANAPSVIQAAKNLGIAKSTLYKWVKEYAPKVTNVTNIKKHDINTLLVENRRLNKELALAQQEREILKKAAAYFAKEQL